MQVMTVEPEDQVLRKLAYERDHPGTEFFPPCEHEARWRACLEDGALEVRGLDLGELMDHLERLGP